MCGIRGYPIDVLCHFHFASGPQPHSTYVDCYLTLLYHWMSLTVHFLISTQLTHFLFTAHVHTQASTIPHLPPWSLESHYIFQSAYTSHTLPAPPLLSLTCAIPSVLQREGFSCAAVPSEPSDRPEMRPGSWCSTLWAWCAPQQPQCTKRPTPHQERGEKWQQDGWGLGSSPLLGCTNWKLQGHAEVCRSRGEERSILNFQCQWHNDNHNGSKAWQKEQPWVTVGVHNLQVICLKNSRTLIIQQHIKELEYFHWQLWYQSSFYVPHHNYIKC